MHCVVIDMNERRRLLGAKRIDDSIWKLSDGSIMCDTVFKQKCSGYGLIPDPRGARPASYSFAAENNEPVSSTNSETDSDQASSSDGLPEGEEERTPGTSPSSQNSRKHTKIGSNKWYKEKLPQALEVHGSTQDRMWRLEGDDYI